MDKVRISFSSRYIEITLPRIAFVNKNIRLPSDPGWTRPVRDANSICEYSRKRTRVNLLSLGRRFLTRRLFEHGESTFFEPISNFVQNSNPQETRQFPSPPFFPLPPDSSLRHKSASFSRTRDSCEKLERNEK